MLCWLILSKSGEVLLEASRYDKITEVSHLAVQA